SDTDGRIQTDGDEDDLKLNSFPLATSYTITLEKNREGYPTEVNEVLQIGQSTKQYSIFKISEQNGLTNYKLKYDTVVTILVPANREYTIAYIRFQNSTYTWTGSSYTRTSDENDLKTEPITWTPEISRDIQYRLMFLIRNPFFYQEVRKYDNAEII
ncbi:MAG: hypothetical protein AABY22_14920, partial [Nanoarchaeota archaeon]